MADKKIKYICEGTCGAEVTAEEHDAGLHVCGTPGCTHHGQHFTPVEIEDDSDNGEEKETESELEVEEEE